MWLEHGIKSNYRTIYHATDKGRNESVSWQILYRKIQLELGSCIQSGPCVSQLDMSAGCVFVTDKVQDVLCTPCQVLPSRLRCSSISVLAVGRVLASTAWQTTPDSQGQHFVQ